MKIGLIGINSLKEENHFLLINEALGKHLYGIFSPQSEEILPICRNHKKELFTSTSELFNQVDAVYFAKSLKPNFDFALNALKKSCHLFIEDISMLTIEEIKQLYKVAFEARTKIQIKLTKSFSPEYLQVKNSITEPKLIEINRNFTSLIRVKDYFSEFLNNLFLADQNISSGIKKASTFVLSIDVNHFSVVHTRLDYDNGAIVNMKFDNISIEDSDSIVIHEKDRAINIDFSKRFACTQMLINGQITRKEYDIQNENAFHLEMNNFINSCKNMDLQNISESPSILKIIQNAHIIMDHLSNASHHNNN